MRRVKAYIAIAVLAIAIALMQLPAHANLYPGSIALPGTDDATTYVQNAPVTATPEQAALAPTQEQKDTALKIAATSPLCKQYNAYPDESWSVGWTGVPPDGHTLLVSKLLSDGYYLDIFVDLNTGSITKSEHNEPLGEYADPFSGTTNTDSSTIGTTSKMPFQLSSIMSYPASSIGFGSTNLFSSGSTGYNPIVTTPATDMSSVSSSDSTPLIPVIAGSSANQVTYLPVGFDSGFQWPGIGYNKLAGTSYTASTAPSTHDSVNESNENIPAITQKQKDKAIKIAATAPDCKKYNMYPDEGSECEWHSPYDGHDIDVSVYLGDKNGTVYGNCTEIIEVDIDKGCLVN